MTEQQEKLDKKLVIERLGLLKDKEKLTQNQFADIFEKRKATVSEWFTKGNITRKQLEIIAEHFGEKYEYFTNHNYFVDCAINPEFMTKEDLIEVNTFIKYNQAFYEMYLNSIKVTNFISKNQEHLKLDNNMPQFQTELEGMWDDSLSDRQEKEFQEINRIINEMKKIVDENKATPSREFKFL